MIRFMQKCVESDIFLSISFALFRRWHGYKVNLIKLNYLRWFCLLSWWYLYIGELSQAVIHVIQITRVCYTLLSALTILGVHLLFARTRFLVNAAKNKQQYLYLQLQIWDTAGQEKFKSLTLAYYRNAHACVVVYDISNGDSFLSCRNWIKEIAVLRGDVPKVLLGNVNQGDFRIDCHQWQQTAENPFNADLHSKNNSKSVHNTFFEIN